jgi:hypothetical protein
MIPVLTVLGLQFGALLAGAIVTEKIFSWPGLGRLTIDAISNRRMRIGPSAKFGNDNPNRLTTESSRSSHRFLRRADRTPAGIERITATSNEASVSRSV